MLIRDHETAIKEIQQGLIKQIVSYVDVPVTITVPTMWSYKNFTVKVNGVMFDFWHYDKITEVKPVKKCLPQDLTIEELIAIRENEAIILKAARQLFIAFRYYADKEN